jgi:hypothetical protein
MATPNSVDVELKARLQLISGGRSADSANLCVASYTHKRRVLSREQGRALETIGHAVDYLTDSYIHEGTDHGLINFRGPGMDAVHILVGAQRHIHTSLPFVEPFRLRLWQVLLRRKSQLKSAVVPLSSSR